MNENDINECCPKFDPTPWDDKLFNWENKRFIKDKVFTLFYMPINFGNVIKRMMEKIGKAGVDIPDYLCLSDHTSKWNMDIYLAVEKEVPEAENVKLNGNYYSKVYEGNFKETASWCKDYDSILLSKKMKREKMYMWYTTCPKCAKKYGKNYVAVVSKIF